MTYSFPPYVVTQRDLVFERNITFQPSKLALGLPKGLRNMLLGNNRIKIMVFKTASKNNQKMKIRFLALIFTLFLTNSLFGINLTSRDTLKFCFSFNYDKDLSDTYGGGDIFSGEIGLTKSWYGASISYGHFQSRSTFILRVPVEGLNYMIDIPFDEMALMKMGTLSFRIIPIKNKRFSTELLFGIAYGKAERSCYKSVDFSYSTVENRFTYLLRDYQLIEKEHFGYQAGISLIYFPSKNVGLKLNTRIQDLSHGGTFFLAGCGLCFRF